MDHERGKMVDGKSNVKWQMDNERGKMDDGKRKMEGLQGKP